MSCSICKQRGHNKATCASNTEKVVRPPNDDRYKEIRPFLGTKPDSEVARDFGVSKQRVRKLRQRWAIPPYVQTNSPDQYHPGIMARLGVESDAEIARDYGISRQRVFQLRQERNIPSPKAWIERAKQEIVPLLGTVPDTEIARTHKLSPYIIRRVRVKYNIPTAPPQGRHLAALDAVREKIGQVSDRQLSRELGIGTSSIWEYRHRNKIPAHPRALNRTYVARRIFEGASDREIAVELRATIGAIGTIRRKELHIRRRKPTNAD